MQSHQQRHQYTARTTFRMVHHALNTPSVSPWLSAASPLLRTRGGRREAKKQQYSGAEAEYSAGEFDLP